ncbi:hypothetical protein SADUNF_Sadunf01G0079700 [Salix dunnii]|uniref:Uncharacterized protein n=1 Tax=Salix dunnii TaxID=1413687 RepID=A0A835NAM3_9ROSI|nr:hypothetical protein SADUNF_Sadunf01G0079700 [Salix dunnii]
MNFRRLCMGGIAKRGRGRTPTPGRYQGRVRDKRGMCQSYSCFRVAILISTLSYVMVVAIDDAVATHLADGMTETLIQGTEEEDHAL